MTIETWMTEAGLPIAQKPATELAAAKLSLRKWEAMRGDVLKRHGLTRADVRRYQRSDGCGLCHYHDEGPIYDPFDVHGRCTGCVLAASGNRCEREDSPWEMACLGDVSPMIFALQEAVKTLEEEQWSQNATTRTG